MPLRRGSVGFSRFALEGEVPKDVRRWVTKALTKRAFEPIDLKSDDDLAQGFVELEDQDSTSFSPGAVFFGKHALFAWRVEKLRVPAGRLREQVAEWAKAFEEREGRSPGRREKTEAKEAARRAMRSKVEPSRKLFDVAIALDAKEVHVWATSRGPVEEVREALELGLELKLVPRVPASFVRAEALERLTPTAALTKEEGSRNG